MQLDTFRAFLEEFQMSSSYLVGDLKNFVEARSSTNENFKFWYQFLERHEIALDLLRADREGLWQLHLDAMQRALYEFAAWDSTNYLRWGTVYLEDARNLPETAPTVYSHFADGLSFSQLRTSLGTSQQLVVIRSLSRPSIFH